ISIFGIVVLGLTSGPCLAPASEDDSKDKAAIRENAKAFVEAFQKGDAKALAEFFARNGECTDETGRELKGRGAIEKAFEGLFAQNKGLKLRINSLSLRFLTPDVAIEEGTSAVITPDRDPPSHARYTNVHVKKDGRWLIGSSKLTVSAPANNSEHLHELEWLLGEWSDEAEKGEVSRVSVDWAENQTFIVATFGSTFKSMTIGGGTQWIGWNPVEKHIRSWTFDANGGYGDGVWTKEGDKWSI